MSLLQFPNYTCITQGKYCSQHGGLVIYLHHKYSFENYVLQTKSDICEGLIIKVVNNNNNKHLYLCNIYRPPRDNLNIESIHQFIDEVNVVLSDLNRHNSLITVLGDINIDLLHIYDRIAFKDYLDNMISQGLYPMITLPTRLTDHSSTLIDNIFSNFNKPHLHSSGVFVSNISDHFPCFYTLPSNSDYANILNTNIDYSRKYTPHNLNKLYQDLESIIWFNAFRYKD